MADAPHISPKLLASLAAAAASPSIMEQPRFSGTRTLPDFYLVCISHTVFPFPRLNQRFL